MKEKDYNKWLEAKSEVEHFNELDDDVKKMIYDIEQSFYDGPEEINLEDIIIEKKEVYFYWVGFEKEVERIQEDYGIDEREAEKIADYWSHDSLTELLNDYTHNFHDWIFCV